MVRVKISKWEGSIISEKVRVRKCERVRVIRSINRGVK